jgi:hypothetical protein
MGQTVCFHGGIRYTSLTSSCSQVVLQRYIVNSGNIRTAAGGSRNLVTLASLIAVLRIGVGGTQDCSALLKFT